MLVLYETAAGYALFKLLDEGKLTKGDDLHKEFATPAAANKSVKLQAFHKFENTVDALSAVTALVEGKISKNLKTFLTTDVSEKEWKKESLAVADSKLASAISKKLGIKVVADSSVNELYRGIRSQIESLLTSVSPADMAAMELGLSHSLSRYKLKFSPDKVDTMIVQAISLLDDLDKELNTYAMRVKEWYGWHFPEMAKIINDNQAYAKLIKKAGFRNNIGATDLGEILPEELEAEIKEAAEISMGTEISDEDLLNITALCDQVISITEYRAQLYEYLKNRMFAIAPNLTALVGELVGARLIAHAGSLMTLAKYPASTIQILGAEKALFRALKTKHDTPKYGLIYHASLVGQAGPKAKGKIARLTATKTSIAVRVDALGDTDAAEVGIEGRVKIENRLRQLEGRFAAKAARVDRTKVPATPLDKKFERMQVASYNTASDAVAVKAEKPAVVKASSEKKRKASDDEESDASSDEEEEKKKAKKEKKEKKDKSEKKEKKEKKEKSKDKDEKKAKKEKKEKKSKD
ncbi:Nucleolar protein 58 [Coemansia sp. S610]|uniref:Nucleolar protein 58 n=1 Tax=Coemansia spiralis TaxID=417178 RepID=A0A9W8GLL8_9FUNG|nr:Nucleolar protein 58 [Coemansia sp. S610]KAJ2690139.1 Nucleolar protein 58 [Coemansia spiralis]KAJ2703167.1 Nucleolar protein 58 [Coemansia sp. IMI 209128]